MKTEYKADYETLERLEWDDEESEEKTVDIFNALKKCKEAYDKVLKKRMD